MDVRLIHPFTCVIAGPTGSGKTHFVRNFLNDISSMMNPAPQDIFWFYGAYQPIFREFRNVSFIEGIPSTEDWKDDRRRLVIVDDLMAECDGRITSLFTKGSHHKNISVIFIVQNLFSKNKEQRTISLNSHYIVIFKNPRDASQINVLARQMFPGKSRYMVEAYKDATQGPYGYLLVDLRQETPDHLRLRTNIFPSEIQVVYIQK